MGQSEGSSTGGTVVTGGGVGNGAATGPTGTSGPLSSSMAPIIAGVVVAATIAAVVVVIVLRNRKSKVMTRLVPTGNVATRFDTVDAGVFYDRQAGASSVESGLAVHVAAEDKFEI